MQALVNVRAHTLPVSTVNSIGDRWIVRMNGKDPYVQPAPIVQYTTLLLSIGTATFGDRVPVAEGSSFVVL